MFFDIIFGGMKIFQINVSCLLHETESSGVIIHYLIAIIFANDKHLYITPELKTRE
jgi:hypothetical protein